jgi:hypothetical protein
MVCCLLHRIDIDPEDRCNTHYDGFAGVMVERVYDAVLACTNIPLNNQTKLGKTVEDIALFATCLILHPLRFNKNLIMNLDRVQTSLAPYPGIHHYPISYFLIIPASENRVGINQSPPIPDVFTTNADIWAEDGPDEDGRWKKNP